jgi:hypothetical protein
VKYGISKTPTRLANFLLVQLYLYSCGCKMFRYLIESADQVSARMVRLCLLNRTACRGRGCYETSTGLCMTYLRALLESFNLRQCKNPLLNLRSQCKVTLSAYLTQIFVRGQHTAWMLPYALKLGFVPHSPDKHVALSNSFTPMSNWPLTYCKTVLADSIRSWL